MSTSDRGAVHTRGGVDVADAAKVVAHLRTRGLLDTAGVVVVEELSGGVSNHVLAVEGTRAGARSSMVVKRALNRLKVAEVWLADPGRLLTEAQALEAAFRIQPDVVPRVLDVDPDAMLMVIERAAAPVREWKADLLGGTVDLGLAGRLGTVLGTWHERTSGTADIERAFASLEAFGQLRVHPFYEWVGARHPDLAARIDAVAGRMAERRTCLVHGDFSPKNVLLGRGSMWVIDWEVAHYGDPTFDVAFLMAHLLCKALHQPGFTTAYQQASTAFHDAYLAATRGVVPFDGPHLAAQTACLLLARMDGKSPVPYLDDAARAVGRKVARSVIETGAVEVGELWRRLR